MRLIIDRFEGIYAICEKEDKTMVDIEKDKLPKNAKIGDVIEIARDSIYINTKETEKRRKEIEELTKDLWA